MSTIVQQIFFRPSSHISITLSILWLFGNQLGSESGFLLLFKFVHEFGSLILSLQFLLFLNAFQIKSESWVVVLLCSGIGSSWTLMVRLSAWGCTTINTKAWSLILLNKGSVVISKSISLISPTLLRVRFILQPQIRCAHLDVLNWFALIRVSFRYLPLYTILHPILSYILLYSLIDKILLTALN